MNNLRDKQNNSNNEVSITISGQAFLRLALMVVGTILLIGTLHKASHALTLIFIAFFLALALNAPVNWLSHKIPGKKRGSRVLATAFSFFVIIGVLGTFLAFLTPPLIRQTETFISAAPSLVRDFRDQNSFTGRVIRKYHLQGQVEKVSNQLSDRAQHLGGTAFSTARRVSSSVFSLLTILVLTYMMLVEGPAWLVLTKDILPNKHHKMAGHIGKDMYRVIRGFVNGQVLLAAIAALLISPALFILHISYPVALMVVVFICGLIPLVGHTIGAIIVTLVALFQSPGAALAILIYYFLYQQFENYIIQPKIQANATNMSPLLVFSSVVIGISFGGLFGGLLAIPVAGCLRILVLEYLQAKNVIDAPDLTAD